MSKLQSINWCKINKFIYDKMNNSLMNKKLLLKLKYHIIIGTIFSTIFSIMNFFFFDNSKILIYMLPFLFFIGGITIEYFNHTDKLQNIFINGFLIGIYEGIMYFLLYFVLIEIIIKRSFETNCMFKYNYGLFFPFLIMIIFVYFIPMNIIGGLIVYGYRKICIICSK